MQGKGIKAALVVLALSSGTSIPASADEDRNNQLHVVGSLAIGSVAQYYIEDHWLSFGACMGVGALKELADHTGINPNGGAQMTDIYWNALGCTLGVAGMKGFQIYQDSDAVMLEYEYKF